MADIVWIVIICTSMNHMGLVAVVERIIRHRLPIVNCVKCSTFWSVLLYGVAKANFSLFTFHSSLPTLHTSLKLLALSFLASYAAIWLELIMFSIDTLYNHIYDTLTKNNHQEESDSD